MNASARFAVAIACAAIAWTGRAHAAASCTARSADTVLPVVELFTSEGCNSCPPADRWLSRVFPSGAERSSGASVLAFHVDYWDGLGWRDRFASPQFTARQQREVRAGGGRVVYTPQVLVQGRDHGLWREDGPQRAWRAASRQPAGASIALDVQRNAHALVVKVDAAMLHSVAEPQLFVALVESGLASDVRAGENAGTHLTHDHVVRLLVPGPAFDSRGEASGTVSLPLPVERGRDPVVVAFVQDARTAHVLQSLQAACKFD